MSKVQNINDSKDIQKALLNPRAKKRTKEQLESLIQKLLKGQFLEGLISYKIEERSPGRWSMKYQTKALILKH